MSTAAETPTPQEPAPGTSPAIGPGCRGGVRPLPLRRKLLAAMLTTSIVSLLLACVVLVCYEFYAYQESMQRNLEVLARTIAANSSAILIYGDKDLGHEMLSSFRFKPEVVAACFYDKDGHVYSTYPAGAGPAAFPTAPGPDGMRFIRGYLTSCTPVQQAGARVGTLYVREDLSGLYNRVSTYLAVVLAVVVAASLLAFLLSRFFQGRIAQPILGLAATARRISEQKDFAVRADTPSDAEELAVLHRAFNEMLEQIHQRDLSLQRSAQALEARVVERTRSLEETTRQLYDFCYTIAHDLKAPIRAQGAYARLLLEDFGPQLGTEGTAYARRILEAADRQTRLVSDLLAHVSLGRSELPLTAVDLAAMAEQVRADLQPEAAQPNAVLDVAGVQGTVVANAASLHLVLLNLLTNGLKFVPRGTAPQVKAWTEARGEMLRLWVQDNGIGIPPQHLGKIFAMFQRLHTREEYPGTGMGLAIVKRAVERMNGRVGVESEVDKGSRFWVELPCARNGELHSSPQNSLAKG